MPDTSSRPGLLLAHSSMVRVDLRDCDGIHVTIGAVTVRIPPGNFEDLCVTLARALHELSLRCASRHVGTA